MKKIFTILSLAITVAAFSQQDTGIHFEHGLTWQQVQEKAKAENRYIFIDAFTTWCGPCRLMAKTIFPLKEVGEFYNGNFINLKVQLDTTAKDNDEVKSWYADAHDIMHQYHVNVFPTYLFISPQGTLVHRAVGSSDQATFIAKGRDALDPAKQYYTLADRFKNGDRDPVFLQSLAKASMDAYDRAAIPVYTKAYLATQKDLVSEENIRFLDATTQATTDTGFTIIAKNTAAYNKVMGEGQAENKVRQLILEEFYPTLFENEAKPDWQKLQQSLKARYPAYGDEVAANAKVLYYSRGEDWPAFAKAVTAYINQYNKHVPADELNSYAWKIFESCDDAACIAQALQWSKKSVDLTNNPMFIDTYANLLYKTGKKDVAIQWEQKALKLIKESNGDESSYTETLEKMKKGEKTW